MRKWLKRSILGLLLVVALAVAVGYWLFRGTPSWYRPATLTAEQRDAAAQRAENKFRATYNFAAKVQADEQKRLHAAGASTRAPTTSPAQPSREPSADAFTTAFTEDELNAFFTKWATVHRWDAHYGPYISDPAVVLRDGKLILAGTMKDLGAVASVHFRPVATDDGQLSLALDGVYAGRLPMPSAVWEKHRATLTAQMREKLPAWRRGAAISPNGVANGPAVSAALATMMINILVDAQKGETALFLPIDPLDEGAVPVRLTGVSVENRELTLSVESLSPSDRAALLKRIREPHGEATASGR